MVSSTSPTRLNRADHDDEEVILYIGRMQMGKDATFRQPAPTANSRSNDGEALPLDDDSDTFSVFSFKSQEEGFAISSTKSKNIKIVPCVLGQNNTAPKDRIWGCPRFFMTTSPGGKDVSNDHNPIKHEQKSNHLVHHLRRRPPFLQAKTLDVNHLEEIMKGDDIQQKKSLVSVLLHSIFMLMLNRKLHCIYCMLVDACEGQQLDSLVMRVLSQGEYFLRVAFDQQGASSIIKLIRKVKDSRPHAMSMTKVLTTRFMDIMTHPTARDVILQCLTLFPRQPNEVLYEKVILHFQDLAIHEVGCRSLIGCIALIRGDQRDTLLNHIADVSDYLSYDPYGNYVVQNLLGLKNKDITKKITRRLQNQFMGLAVRKGGCLVVEKCMEASDDGIITVAEEILGCQRAACRLARDQFGNYVIYALLKKTKERGFDTLYNEIVRRLERRCRASLARTAGGMRSTQDAYIISDPSILYEWSLMFM